MKEYLLLVFLSVSILASAQIEHSDTVSSDDNKSTELSVLSWNIYMLPPLVKFTGKRKRAHAIGKRLLEKDYDVIVFQEAFHTRARQILKKYLKKKYPHRAGPANNRMFTFKFSSGLWILSKYPIEIAKEIKFKEKTGFDNRMSRKGALLIEIKKDSQSYQIIGTHLNAGGTPELRLSQVRQIREELLLPLQRDSIPQMICGDFNILKKSTTYKKMIELLDAEDGLLSGDIQFTFGSGNDLKERSFSGIIDYILIRNNGLIPISVERKVPIIQYQWHSEHKDLSDHHPVELRIVWK